MRPTASDANILAQEASRADILAGIAFARGIQHHAARGLGIGLAVGKHGLQKLKISQRLAELATLHGVANHVVDDPFRKADAGRCDVKPPFVQHLHRSLEALTFDPADKLPFRHPAIVEDRVADMGPFWPSFFTGLPSDRPGVSRSTAKVETPAAPFFSGSVRAMTVNRPA